MIDNYSYIKAQEMIAQCTTSDELLRIRDVINDGKFTRSQKETLLLMIAERDVQFKNRAASEVFLLQYTPQIIEDELNARIIGQPELTRDVADFLYYHILRQVHESSLLDQ